MMSPKWSIEMACEPFLSRKPNKYTHTRKINKNWHDFSSCFVKLVEFQHNPKILCNSVLWKFPLETLHGSISQFILQIEIPWVNLIVMPTQLTQMNSYSMQMDLITVQYRICYGNAHQHRDNNILEYSMRRCINPWRLPSKYVYSIPKNLITKDDDGKRIEIRSWIVTCTRAHCRNERKKSNKSLQK